MPDSPQNFYLTTPIYYVNARPHIGHAYTTLVADVLARRHRLLGEDVYFLTGTDEHGQKIERSAAAAGIPPQQFTDEVSKTFSDLFTRMGITNNQFIRTTSEKHKIGAQHLFSELYKNGHIYLDSYTGAYCVSDEAFIDAPIGTPCPDCGKLLEEVTEENFFFKLSAFQHELLHRILHDSLQIEPRASKNEVVSFLTGDLSDIFEEYRLAAETDPEIINRSLSALEWGVREKKIGKIDRSEKLSEPHYYRRGALRDLSVSRSSFTWGIPVPEPAASASKQKHVIYVWLDALANYMTALGYGNEGYEAPNSLFKKFWPADLHLVGKEITRFHCIYWPAFLLALNPATALSTDQPPNPVISTDQRERRDPRISPEPPQLSQDTHKLWAKDWLPKQITANGWLLFDNAKMSKSKGNVVRTETILDAFGTLCPPPLHPNTPPSSKPNPNSVISTGAPQNSVISTEAPQNSVISTGAQRSGETPVFRLGQQDSVPTNEPPQPTPRDRDLFATDVLRYYLLREIPFGQDGSFSFEAMITRYNADLANGYGNLVSRTFAMIGKYFEFVIPSPEASGAFHAELLYDAKSDNTDPGLVFFIETVGSSLGSLESNITRDTTRISRIVGALDQYISLNQPWKDLTGQFGDIAITRATVLYEAADAIRIITALLYPILPYATARVWAQLGLGDIEQAAAEGKLKNLQWGSLQPGTKLGRLGPIFPRADKGLAQLMTDLENSESSKLTSSKLSAEQEPGTTSPAAPPRTSSLPEPSGPLTVGGSSAHTTGPHPTLSHTEAPASGIFASQPADSHLASPSLESPQITIDDFAKIDLRVAQITLAERIPKADKLLRLEVDLGPLGSRQILSGIAAHYTPEELLGRRIIVIANLAPRKMRGLESHGMLLAASDPEAGDQGKPHLATVPEGVPLGTRLK